MCVAGRKPFAGKHRTAAHSRKTYGDVWAVCVAKAGHLRHHGDSRQLGKVGRRNLLADFRLPLHLLWQILLFCSL